MSPAGVTPLLLEVVVALDPAARCTGELRRQHRDASRSLDHGHAPMHRRPRVMRSFVRGRDLGSAEYLQQFQRPAPAAARAPTKQQVESTRMGAKPLPGLRIPTT